VNFSLCFSPFSFGYIVLQQPLPNAAQLADLAVPTALGVTRFFKARVLSVASGDIPPEGYVTIRAEAVLGSSNGSCLANDPFNDFIAEAILDGTERQGSTPTPLATWAIVVDVGTGFFATEIPTPTANIIRSDGPSSGSRGHVLGGVGAFGLIPEGNQVIAFYDVNPSVDAFTRVFVWLASNNNGSAYPAVLDCEDELEISTNIPINNEVNIVNPNTLGGIGLCKQIGQFRGVLRFIMPDTGFLWSHITQEGAHFRENFLGYNLGDNDFIDCADGFNDFQSPFEDNPFFSNNNKEDTGHDADEDGIPPLCPPRDFCPE
jgi:hypothetical protein